MTVDVWIQHPTAAFLGHPMFEPLRRWMRLDAAPAAAPGALTRAALDAGGVSRALTCAWYGPQGALIDNDQVAAFVAEDPARLVGVGSVDIRRPVAAIAELRRCVEVLGFRALRLLPWLWDRPPDDRLYYPLYAACVELGVPVCLQVGHTGPLCPSEPGRPIPYLDRVALDFPELTLVGGHIGYPWTLEMIALATKYPRVYIDTSAYKPSRYPPELVEFMKGPGQRKVMFGSNFPMIQPAEALAQVGALGLSPAGKEAFLAGTARAVFGL